MKCWQNNVKNTVAAFGINISDKQIKLLNKFGVRKIVLAFDPDKAGIKAAKQRAQKLNFFFQVENISQQLHTDPSEMSVSDMQKIIQPHL